MSKPIQHHYLPKRSYLSFFDIPTRPGLVYLYQRSKEPIQVSIEKIAKERHLYSFVDKGGNRNSVVEEMLADIDAEAKPILEKLNQAKAPLQITAEEKVRLVRFVTFQAVRTPAFKETLKEVYAGLHKTILQAQARDKKVLKRTLERATKEQGKDILGDLTIEDFQKYILDGDYKIEVADSDHFLGAQIKTATKAFYVILRKDILVLRVEDMAFVTCDHPVIRLKHPHSPSYWGAGFVNSDLLVPIGRHTVLCLLVQFHPVPLAGPDQLIDVNFRKISPHEGRRINKLTLSNAEHYLFSSESNNALKKLFDQTEKPTRMHIDSPFGRIRVPKKG